MGVMSLGCVEHSRCDNVDHETQAILTACRPVAQTEEYDQEQAVIGSDI